MERKGKKIGSYIDPERKGSQYIKKKEGMEDMENFQVIDHYLMIKLPQEIDHHRSTYICEKADQFILQKDVQNVVFDFEETRFMDSSGIGILLGRYRKINTLGGKVYVVHADKQIKRILTMSGVTKIVEIME